MTSDNDLDTVCNDIDSLMKEAVDDWLEFDARYRYLMDKEEVNMKKEMTVAELKEHLVKYRDMKATLRTMDYEDAVMYTTYRKLRFHIDRMINHLELLED